MMILESILYIDNLILNWIYSFKNPVLDKIVPVVTALGNGGAVWIFLCVILLCFKKTRKCGLTIALGLILNLIVCNGILKNLFARIRPYETNGIKELLISFPHDYSFPSGHSSSSFVAATSVFLYYKKSGALALFIATLISLSRLYLYVHYPSDVFFGILIGILLSFVSKAVIKNCENRMNIL